ncbi:MAG: hypothetical protein AAB355_02340 [Patescibacteria group bacterium]
MNYLNLVDKKIWGALAVGLGIIAAAYFLSGGTFPALNLAGDKAKSKNDLAVFIKQDTDGDGVPDWEERLWETDPLKKDTDGDGIPDNEEISKKMAVIQNSRANGGEMAANPSGKIYQITKEVLGNISAGETAELDEETIKNLSQKIAQGISPDPGKIFYDERLLKIVPETKQSLEEYVSNLRKIASLYEELSLGKELVFVYEFVYSKNIAENEEKISLAIKNYKTVGDKIISMNVPAPIAEDHFLLANEYQNLADALQKIKGIFKEPMGGMEGIIEYGAIDKEMSVILGKIGTYLEKGGIILNKGL